MGLDMYAYKTKEFVDDDKTQIKDEKEREQDCSRELVKKQSSVHRHPQSASGID